MTDEKLLDKLRKIKAHADSAKAIGSEAEAQAFADMLQRLLLKHNLELTEVQLEAHEAEEPVSEHRVDYESHGLKFKTQRVAWVERLASIVARAHFCRILVTPGSNAVTLVGRKSDAAVAEYLFVTLYRSADRISVLEYGRYFRECQSRGEVHLARGFRAAFLQSFVMRIHERLQETRRDVVGSSSTAIVRVNRAETAVADYMKKFTRHSTSLSAARRHLEGERRGRAVADRVNVQSNAVGIGTAPKALR